MGPMNLTAVTMRWMAPIVSGVERMAGENPERDGRSLLPKSPSQLAVIGKSVPSRAQGQFTQGLVLRETIVGYQG